MFDEWLPLGISISALPHASPGLSRVSLQADAIAQARLLRQAHSPAGCLRLKSGLWLSARSQLKLGSEACYAAQIVSELHDACDIGQQRKLCRSGGERVAGGTGASSLREQHDTPRRLPL
jgi:hypothetical protein